MPWTFTDDVERFAERVWDLLAAEPARQTIALTVIDSVRRGRRWSDDPMLFGCFEDAAGVRGAVFMTPPIELLLAEVPGEAALAQLVSALRAKGVELPGVNGEATTVDAFAAAWTRATALRTTVATHLRLYELGELRPPAPSPAGRSRPATGDDLELALRWLTAFRAELEDHPADAEPVVRERIADARLWLWEDAAGMPVSLAGRTATTVGVARIAPVYTPPEHRRHGYAAAITAACSADALTRGAGHVVLFTDLANPTSNRIYQQIGFRPVNDSRVVRFEP